MHPIRKNKKDMKTGIYLIPVLVACMAVFVGCGDKDNDFRDKWLGTYEGNCEYHSSTGSDHQFDTVYSDQYLTVSKQGNEGLVMDYLGQSFQVRCSSDGTFTSTSNNQRNKVTSINHLAEVRLFITPYEQCTVSRPNGSNIVYCVVRCRDRMGATSYIAEYGVATEEEQHRILRSTVSRPNGSNIVYRVVR